MDDEKVFDGGWEPEVLPDDPEERFAALEEQGPSLADIAAGIVPDRGGEAAPSAGGPAASERSSVIDAEAAFRERRQAFMRRLGIVHEDAGGKPGSDPSPPTEALAA